MTVQELRDELAELDSDRTVTLFVSCLSFPIQEVLVVTNRHEVLLEAGSRRQIASEPTSAETLNP